MSEETWADEIRDGVSPFPGAHSWSVWAGKPGAIRRYSSMDTAPRDGTPIRLFAKYAPPDGVVAWWSNTYWVSPRGIAAFDFTSWTPIKNETLPFSLPDEQLRKLTE